MQSLTKDNVNNTLRILYVFAVQPGVSNAKRIFTPIHIMEFKS